MYRTQLYDWHVERAKMGIFAGWEMPLWYKGALKEHLAVRTRAGFFDISHMGELFISGDNAQNFIDMIVGANMNKLKPGRAKYTVICNERGAIKDDVIVYKFNDTSFMIICNAVNRKKIVAWINSLIKMLSSMNVKNIEFRDRTFDYGLIAVQGPKSIDIGVDMGLEIPERSFRFKKVEWQGIPILISRTGYTGEDGFEVLIEDSHPYNPDPGHRGSPEKIMKFLEHLMEAGSSYDLEPCGLFSRDTLRIEAGFGLYGNDIWEKQLPDSDVDSITPLECGLEFTVDLSKDFFIGKDAILKRRENIERKQALIKLRGKGIPRPHFNVLHEGKVIGEVTSGTRVPTTPGGIAIALVDADYAVPGTEVMIEIKGKPVEGVVVEKPFYDTDRYGKTRKI